MPLRLDRAAAHPVAAPHRRLLRLATVAAALAAASLASGCADGGYGIDPAVTERALPGPDTPVDTALAEIGARVYRDRCVACHKLDEGIAAGPALRGVTERRDPEWLRGMILSPDSMLRSDSIAQALLREYRVPMIDTRIGEPEFRAVLEYLRLHPEPR